MSLRSETNVEKLRRFMGGLGRAAKIPIRIYFTGGATALLLGWRDSTIDVDLKMIPDEDSVFRALPKLKEELQMNIELASPSDFIPPLPDWEGRSVFIESHGKVQFFHYDFYAQALAKIERGHHQDVLDVKELFKRNLVERAELMRLFRAIEPQIFRYPSLDRLDFRKRVKSWCQHHDSP